MTDRDRLIELIDKAKKEYESIVTDYTETDYIVAVLLNEGVIVPPCKVGDTVYIVGEITGQVISCEVLSIIHTENDYFLHLDNELVACVSQQLGKTVFLTKEEAETKIKRNER